MKRNSNKEDAETFQKPNANLAKIYFSTHLLCDQVLPCFIFFLARDDLLHTSNKKEVSSTSMIQGCVLLNTPKGTKANQLPLDPTNLARVLP